MAGVIVAILMIFAVVGTVIAIIYFQSRKKSREQKNYERGLKMVPVMIHLPPESDDIETGGRDERDVTDEVISQAQTMYNVISSTATKGFKSRFYGQRHISFEIVAHGGSIRYYVVVPTVILENIKQAVMAAYPTARLEEVEEINLFNEKGKILGTVGGEFVLRNEYSFPIATYQESKRDAMRAILNALTSAKRDDGVGIQILIRPANDAWRRTSEKRVRKIKEGRRGASGGAGGGMDLGYFSQLFEVLWKPPAQTDKPQDTAGAMVDKQLSGSDQEKVEAIEEKTRYAGYEVMIRVVASSAIQARAQSLLSNIVSAFALFNSPTKNGFQFKVAANLQEFVTSYIFRFFPPENNKNVLNTVELATLFHLPDQKAVPSSQVERQKLKQVDGPSQAMDEGLLLGYNVYRGVKKPIRLSDNDRRRHIYIMGGTGMGKSVLLENLALQDMLNGKGFAFVDPHGDSAENLLAMVPKDRVEDIVYFDPGDMENPIGLNLFEIDPNDPDKERTKDYIISETMNMLYSLYDPQRQGIVGPRMENIVRNAALLLMDSPEGGTFMDIPKVLVDAKFAKSKIKYLKSQRAIDFWTKEWPDAQRSNDAGEVTSWVVSKWAAFENALMTNILGQTRSTLNFREIMDQKKILLVNLSKGRLGEMPAKLLGMMFVMKFQAAAMSRANIPESERKDFCLFVDEFQNFATDSFESILSEARKYRLNLIVANQFMSQLIDKIREAITGNAGSFIIGRVGFEDAEQVVKIFQPVFDTQDMQFMPNYTAVCKILVNGQPSSPFSMDLVAPMGHPNKELGDAMRRLSAAKYGRPRAEVELEIQNRISAVDRKREEEKKARLEQMRNTPIPGQAASNNSQESGDSESSSFLDNWLAKRKQQRQSMTAQSSSSANNPPTINNYAQDNVSVQQNAAVPANNHLNSVEHSSQNLSPMNNYSQDSSNQMQQSAPQFRENPTVVQSASPNEIGRSSDNSEAVFNLR